MLKIKLFILLTSISGFFVSISKQIYYERVEEVESFEYVINEINGVPNKKEVDAKRIKKVKNYTIIMEIPKINFKKGILSKNDKDNNVDKNVTILKESVYPGEKGNIFIAAHSGTGFHSYFTRIDKLKKNDIVNLYYKNKKYTYKLYDVKYINKNKGISLLTTKKNNLFLITCSQKYKNKYLVLYFKEQH